MFTRNTKERKIWKALTITFLVCFGLTVVGVFLAFADAEAVTTGSVGSLQAAGPDAVKELLDKVVFPVFTGLILSLLSILLHRVSAKYKLDILTANQGLIEKAALQGIALAEEKAAKNIEFKLSGNQKLAIAVDHMRDIIPTITVDQARNVIDGMLARIPGLGATKEMVVDMPIQNVY